MPEPAYLSKSETVKPGTAVLSFTTGGIIRVLCVLGAAVVLWRLMSLVMLVIVAYILASAILPLALRLEKWGLPRVWTVIGVFAFLFASVTILGVLTAPAIGTQFERLVTRAPEQISRTSDWLARKISGMAGRSVRLPEAGGQIAQYLRTAAEHTLQVTAGAVSAVASIILIAVLAGFMVIDQQRFRAGFLRLVPPGARDGAARQWDEVQERVGGYVGGMALISLEKGAVLTLGLWMLGVPSALLLGLLACVLNFIPYVGFWSVFLLAETLAFNADPIKGLWVFLLFMGHEWFKSGFLGPYLIGRTMKLHPAVVLIAIAAGTKLFGLLGTLVAVPLAAAASVIITNLLPALPQTVPQKNVPSREHLRSHNRA